MLDKSYQLEPIERICAGCGKKFLESSIYIRTAIRVELNIQFCYSCYIKILYENDDKRLLSQDRNEMLTNLRELVQAIDFIPNRHTMKDFPLPAFPTDRQIRIGCILLKMPPHKVYVETFGSWLDSLNQAGVIDQYIETTRGIQCIARDGHLCLSLGEKTIDDWFHYRHIPHDKEVQ